MDGFTEYWRLTCFKFRECRFITGTGLSVFIQTCHDSAYRDANPLPGNLPASWQIKSAMCIEVFLCRRMLKRFMASAMPVLFLTQNIRRMCAIKISSKYWNAHCFFSWLFPVQQAKNRRTPGPTGNSDQGDRNNRNLPADKGRADLCCQAGLEERAQVHWEDPVVQPAGNLRVSILWAKYSSTVDQRNNLYLGKICQLLQLRTGASCT